MEERKEPRGQNAGQRSSEGGRSVGKGHPDSQVMSRKDRWRGGFLVGK